MIAGLIDISILLNTGIHNGIHSQDFVLNHLKRRIAFGRLHFPNVYEIYKVCQLKTLDWLKLWRFNFVRTHKNRFCKTGVEGEQLSSGINFINCFLINFKLQLLWCVTTIFIHCTEKIFFMPQFHFFKVVACFIS